MGTYFTGKWLCELQIKVDDTKRKTRISLQTRTYSWSSRYGTRVSAFTRYWNIGYCPNVPTGSAVSIWRNSLIFQFGGSSIYNSFIYDVNHLNLKDCGTEHVSVGYFINFLKCFSLTGKKCLIKMLIIYSKGFWITISLKCCWWILSLTLLKNHIEIQSKFNTSSN